MPAAIALIVIELAEVAIATAPSWAPELAFSVGLSIVSNVLLAPKLPKSEDGAYPISQPIPPRQAGYGKARVARFHMLGDLA